jgi:hypothetical protein
LNGNGWRYKLMNYSWWNTTHVKRRTILDFGLTILMRIVFLCISNPKSKTELTGIISKS